RWDAGADMPDASRAAESAGGVGRRRGGLVAARNGHAGASDDARRSRARRGGAMRPKVLIAAALALAGAALFGNGVYLHAKARVAQLLLARAWSRTLHGEREVKPWAWVDTWPVARIELP